MSAIALKDWREFRRDSRLVLATLFVLLLAVAASLAARAQVAAHEADRATANTRDRQTWEAQGSRNPHSVAHFATWAFRPLTPLAVLDPGITQQAGSAIWMEAHNRNPAAARPVADSVSTFAAGSFSLAWLLQTIAPLLLFVIAAGAVARERERGTLRMMLASGLTADDMVVQKAGAVGRIGAALVLPVLAAALLGAVAAGPVDPLRLILWTLGYLLFFGTITLVAVAVSARSGSAARALMLLIAVWLVAAVLVPRIGASLAERLQPTPSIASFWAGIEADTKTVPDVFGDGADAFGAEMAKRYGVASVKELPVSFEGLQLDAAEHLEATVRDRHFAELHRRYRKQLYVVRATSLLSPVPALQSVSMALAGTDLAHQLEFERQAEAHRMALVGALNRDMIEHGGSAGFDYRADDHVWRETAEFAFATPPLADVLRSIWPDILILTAWLLAAFLLLRASARQLACELVR